MPARSPVPQPQPQPPFYEAAEDIFSDNPEAGVVPVTVYHEGDRISPEKVARLGIEGKVRVPAQFVPPAPPSEAAPAAGKE